MKRVQMPHTVHAKASALAASARISNLPSVWSNTLAGGILAFAYSDRSWDMGVCGLLLVLMSLGVCFYAGGNVLNDWKDWRWDQVHRPERALPSGMFQPGFYLGLAWLLMIAGLCLAAWCGWLCLGVAVVLWVMILGYTWLHKKTGWAVLWMGGCRACLPCLGYVAVTGAWPRLDGSALALAAMTLALFLHVVGLSLWAREESKSAGSGTSISRKTVWMFPLAALLMGASVLNLGGGVGWLRVTVAAIPYLGWVMSSLSEERGSIGERVSRLLSAIPLLDGIALFSLGMSGLGGSGDVLVWLALGFPVLSFFSALKLQQWSPAT